MKVVLKSDLSDLRVGRCSLFMSCSLGENVMTNENNVLSLIFPLIEPNVALATTLYDFEDFILRKTPRPTARIIPVTFKNMTIFIAVFMIYELF